MGVRRGVTGAAALVAVLALAGCVAVVGNATDDLLDELLRFEIVEGGFASSGEGTLFDEGHSSISLDLAEDADPDQLDELVTYWRFGVDGIEARWMLGLSKPGGDGGYDGFRVSGVRSVADLGSMVRFWHRLGPATRSADIWIYDYSDDTDGSVQLDLDPQPSARLHDLMSTLREESYELPGRFQWSVDADIPVGSVSVAGTNVLPDEHMLDVLAALAEPVRSGSVGPIWFWAIESDDPFQPGNPLRLNVGVYLEPPSIDDLGADGDAAWQDLGDRVLTDPDVWPVILEIARRLPQDEQSVTLSFSVYGDQLAHLDPLACPSDGAEKVYGPLNSDVWSSWGGGPCVER